MSKKALERASRNAVRITLSKSFAEELRAQADLQGRSMAAQLEHWARIAMSVEATSTGPAIASVELAPLSDTDALRSASYRFLLGPSLEATTAQLGAAGLPNYGMSPSKPGVILRIDPDGTQTEGHVDAQGEFVPDSPSSSAKGKARKHRSRK